MKRWFPWLALALLVAGLIVAGRPTSPKMLQDTDTRALVTAIRERHAPLSWFGGDWPIANHFYRPVSTLTLEADNALYGDNAAGYGLTNALLEAGCVLGLFWLLRELTDKPWLAGTAAALFGAAQMQANGLSALADLLMVLAPVSLLGLFRKARPKASLILAAAVSIVYVCLEIASQSLAITSVVAWIPGRTATTMTLFALVATAAYARWERLGAEARAPTPTPLDPPATKGTVARQTPGHNVGVWLALAYLAAALALGSYEQAVMLPAVLLAAGALVSLRGLKPRWWAHAGFWALLGAYLALRAALVPSSASGYQLQQLRRGPSIALALINWLAPGALHIAAGYDVLAAGIITVITGYFWLNLAQGLGNFSAWALLSRDRDGRVALGLLGASFLAYLPMAWLKPFDHYMYWPTALRAPFIALALAVSLKALATAVAPRALQAPSRPHPAPGSLPRP